MGQKVNPHGLRVGIIKDWDSEWYDEDCKEIVNLKDCGLKIGRIIDWESRWLKARTRNKIYDYNCTRRSIKRRMLPRQRLT